MAVGVSDEFVKISGRRREIFAIANNEQLIGCKLYKDEKYLIDVKW